MTNQTFPSTSHLGGDQYLESMIRTASPARLRLMTIERGIEVAERLARLWRDGQLPGSNEHSLKLLDLLNELLSGITGGTTQSEQAVCVRVADLYVFLVQHLLAAEERSDASAIEEIRLVLQTEAETWRAVCAAEAGSAGYLGRPDTAGEASPATGLNFEA